MQQLTLQFDGYADSRPVIDVGTTKPCKRGVFYKAIQHFLEGLGKSAAKPSGKKSIAMGFRRLPVMSWLRQESTTFSALSGEHITRLNAICGSAAVVFSILMVSFAALIGG